MTSETKLTRQGIRDLNHYGPKRQPTATIAPRAVEEPVTIPAPQPLPTTETVAPLPRKE
jgi:hypothetical protein